MSFTSHVYSSDVVSVKNVFEAENSIQLVLDVAAALARTQARQGIIPEWAAQEITDKASLEYAPLSEIVEENHIVGHKMVALLNVWTRSIQNGADEFVHFGATTVDIYDTVMILQLQQTILFLIQDLRALEAIMLKLAEAHRDTVMIGRTIGQHALPITFGKKVATWLGENRRNIERLQRVLISVRHSAILKGAVGSYLGLGDLAIETEKGLAKELGLEVPYADDWHSSRDVLAEYASILAIISKSYGRIGNELFLLQMTDIGETTEVMSESNVGSSTMPHKKNPRKPEKLTHYSRVIPRFAEVILDDMVNSFERDDTSEATHMIAQISIETEKMFAVADALLSNLRVNKITMRDNLEKTRGLIMAQRVTFALADHIGKTTANSIMHDVSIDALSNELSLGDVLKKHPEISRYFTQKELGDLLDSSTYLGLAVEQVDVIVGQINEKRKIDSIAIPNSE